MRRLKRSRQAATVSAFRVGSLKDGAAAAAATGSARSAHGSLKDVDVPADPRNPVYLSGQMLDGNGQISASTSLSEIRRLSLKDGPDTAALHPFDLRLQVRAGGTDRSIGTIKQRGSDGIAYIGADYAIHPAVLVGILALWNFHQDGATTIGGNCVPNSDLQARIEGGINLRFGLVSRACGASSNRSSRRRAGGAPPFGRPPRYR